LDKHRAFTGHVWTGLDREAERIHSKRVGGRRRGDGSSEVRHHSGGTETKRPCRGSGRSRTQETRRGFPEPKWARLSGAQRREPLAPALRKHRQPHETWVLVLKTESVWVADVDRACLSAVDHIRLRSGGSCGLAVAETSRAIGVASERKPQRKGHVSVETRQSTRCALPGAPVALGLRYGVRCFEARAPHS